MVDIAELPGADAHVVVVEEHAQRNGDGGVQVGGRRVAAGYEAQQVHGEHIDENSHEQGHETAALFAHVVHDEAFKAADERLEEDLQLAGHDVDVLAHHVAHDGKDSHAEPGEEHVLRVDGHTADRDGIEIQNGREQKRMGESAGCCHGGLLCKCLPASAPENQRKRYDRHRSGKPGRKRDRTGLKLD